MAKKKQKKDEEKKKFEYSNEVIGIILILASIIGIGAYGPAGNFIRSFAIFLVGNIYIFLLVGVLILGGYLIVKRKSPNFSNLRWIGFYIITISFLILLHVKYITHNSQEGIKIITETFDNLLKTFSVSTSEGILDTISQSISNSGGGMIGAIFTYIFYSLFKNGTNIVVITLIVIGVILLFNTSIIELIKKIKLPKIKKREHKEKNKEDEEDKRIIVSSSKDIDKLTEKEIEEPDIPIKTVTSNAAVAVNNNEEIEEKPVINVNYKLPPLTLLKLSKGNNDKENVEAVKQNINTLEKVLADFEIPGKIKECHIGPSVTQYELELQAGTKVNKLLSIQKEIALNLAAKDVRIQAPIPGKSTIGIELPNKVNSAVSFREVLSKLPTPDEKSILAVGLGKDIMGSVKWCEINTTPHLLIAGATGSGKSVCINCVIASILMRSKPDEVKLVMVDPKKVELSMYNGVPHLLTPVVTDPKKASIALKNIVVEMERRYQIFEDTKCKNISAYNKMCEEKTEYQKMPYIVFIIDELADLMLVAAKDVEDSIMRITQMARAAGIHLIVATQRPSTDVITGVVKANIPSRISFAVSSSIDSRTILDQTGAEKLLGKGDMLFKPMGENVPIRIQGAYVSDEELQKIVDFTISQQKANYDHSITEERGESSSSDAGKYDDGYESKEEYDDPLYNDIVDFAMEFGKISASLIQRKYRIGYNRAARIVDLLEERGIIGPQNGSKPREVLVKKENNSEEE
ncbi:MAG: cell division protein FtsK [Bacilli bacterium]|nr:cell division protein FtsK [Bacilli bacterium]